jgi:hypothetical protein
VDSLSHDQFTQLSVTFVAIWTARRKAIHEDIVQSPLPTHGFINFYLEELRQLAKPVSTVTRSGNHMQVHDKWIPPPSNLNKINVDAAVSKIGGKRGGNNFLP